MNLPTEQDINPFPEDLDGLTAVSHFLGKTQAQITAEFLHRGISYQEDLMFMGPVAFCFYFPAAVEYVVSPEATGDWEVVSALCGVIDFRLKTDGQRIRDAFPAIARFVDHVTARDPDESARLETLRQKLAVISGQHSS